MTDAAADTHDCAVTDCSASATRHDKIEGRDVRIAHIELPKAKLHIAAWLCDNHKLEDTGFLKLD